MVCVRSLALSGRNADPSPPLREDVCSGARYARSYSGSLYDQSVESVLPQLPGYRSNRHAIANRNQTLKYNSKQMFLTEARNAPRYAQHASRA